MTAYKHWSLLSLLSLSLIACGGGTSSQDGSRSPAAGMEGRVTLQGGLAGATIFVDLNGSDSLDDDEPVGYTDSQGFFGYNPITRTNYCKSSDLNLNRHCLRLPSLSNLPDEVTVFYLGGVNLVTGEQNDRVYRYHVRVSEWRGRDLDLNAAKATLSAVADSDDNLAILYGIIDAFYDRYINAPAPLGRSLMPYASGTATTQEKLDALMQAGVFQGSLDHDLDENMTRAQVASIITRLTGLDTTAPPHETYADISGSEWAAGFIAQASASFMGQQTEGVYAPGGNVTMEQLAAIMVRVLGLETGSEAQVGDVSDWAKAYVQAAVNANLLPGGLDYTSPATRELLVQASYLAHQDVLPDADTQVNNQVSIVAQELVENLQQDGTLNDSFSETEFDDLLDGLSSLIHTASQGDQRINLDVFRQFLADPARDWTAWGSQDFGALLLDQDFFDNAIAYLKGRVLEIAYDDATKGNGRLQLLLSQGSSAAGLDSGRLQACVRYEEVGVPDAEQRFKQPLYVSGDWTRINDNSLLLNMHLLPGYTYTRVLQLDWADITPDPADLTRLRFDMTDALEDWSFGVLPAVDPAWQTMDSHRDAANAHCAHFLAD